MKKVAIWFIICLALLFAFEHFFLTYTVRSAVSYVTALDIGINRVTLNPFKGSIRVRGLKIFNPSTFRERILLSAPLLVLDFKARSLFERGSFFDQIVLSIKEFNIVRNKEGQVNLARLKALAPKTATVKKEAPPMPFMVESLVFEIGRVRYIDFSEEAKEREKVIELNLKEEYKRIRSPFDIVKVIVYKVFFSGKLGNIGVNINSVQQDLQKLAEENKNLAQELQESLQAEADNLKELTKEKAAEAKSAIQDKAGQVKEAVAGQIDKMKEAAGRVSQADQGGK